MKTPLSLPVSPVPLLPFLLSIAISFGTLLDSVAAPDQGSAEVLLIAGPSKHPPGTHEPAAGARLLAYCLEQAGLDAQVVYEWPTDAAVLHKADTIALLGDQFPPERFENSDAIMTQLAAEMERGCGLVCIHYATGLGKDDVAPDGEHPLLHWTGGYFATRCEHHQSIAKIFTATITPGESEHPVLRGWQAFTLLDEPYYNNYFGRSGLAENVTPLAFSQLPPEDPHPETVAWAVERADGGRGMGIVMPHFFKNWKVEELRKFILNGIVWSAGQEIPKDGIVTTLPDLATFEPMALEPQPRQKPANAKADAGKNAPPKE